MCGACTVIVDGAAVRSCLVLSVQVEGSSVVTVEGLSSEEALSPLQTAFRKHHALQCGFCTPGMLTTAHALLTRNRTPMPTASVRCCPAICAGVPGISRLSRPCSDRGPLTGRLRSHDRDNRYIGSG